MYSLKRGYFQEKTRLKAKFKGNYFGWKLNTVREWCLMLSKTESMKNIWCVQKGAHSVGILYCGYLFFRNLASSGTLVLTAQQL